MKFPIVFLAILWTIKKVTRRAGRPRTYSGLAACAFGPRAATVVKLIQHVFLAGAIVAVCNFNIHVFRYSFVEVYFRLHQFF